MKTRVCRAPLRWQSVRFAGNWMLAVVTLILLSARPSQAQFGFGFGGFGIYARPYTPPSVNFLYDRANARVGVDTGAPKQLKEPDRFAYRKQYIEMQERASFNSRQPTSSQIGSRQAALTSLSKPDVQRGAVPRGQTVSRSQAPPITRFINQQGEVAWPADAPVTGSLAAKREQANKAIQTVVDQYQANNAVSVEAVAKARQDLVVYGKPALATLRQQTSPSVAESFHLFLLALYDSLAQAAQGRSATS